MSKKPSLVVSTLKLNCPRCREGKLFLPNTWYRLNGTFKMYKRCSCCGQNFVPEPGFYFGAMYVSYGINVAVFFGLWILMSILSDHISVIQIALIHVAITLALLPVFLRVSRSVWLYLFIKYEGNCKEIPFLKGSNLD